MKVSKKIVVIPLVIILSIITVLGFKSSRMQKITLNNDNITLSIGEVFTIKPKEKGNYSFESDNEKIAVTDKDGNVTAKSAGETIIKVVSAKGYETSFKIVVESADHTLKFSEEIVNIEEDSSKKLKYEILDDDFKVESIKWSSSDESVAEVKDGKVKAKKVGRTTIRLTVNDNIYVECIVNVVIEINKLYFKDSKVTIEQGEITSLDYTIKPSDATERELTWISEDEKIVEVDKFGNITGISKGETTIRVESKNGKKDSIKVKVKEIEAKSVSIDKSNLDMYKNNTTELKATIKPANTSNQEIKWSSSNEKIAVVDSNGKVTAKAPGKVKITAKTVNGKKEDVRSLRELITYGLKGTPVGYGWANYIGDHFEIGKTINEGHSGWFISNKYDIKWINTIVKNYAGKSYDYVILHGGTNDISKGVELGTFNENDFNGNYDEKTFLGGLETYLYTVKKQFPNAKVGYIINYETPYNTENRRKLSASYYTEMKKVLDKWKVPYLDLFFGQTDNGVKYSDLLKVTTTEYLTDTLHLNKEGYKLISPYIFNWMNEL